MWTEAQNKKRLERGSREEGHGENLSKLIILYTGVVDTETHREVIFEEIKAEISSEAIKNIKPWIARNVWIASQKYKGTTLGIAK